MKDKTVIVRIFVLLSFLSSILKCNAQQDIDWSKLYSDRYYFSREFSDQSVVVNATKDSMIIIWLNGVKDSVDYSQGRKVDYFEGVENGVGIFIESFDDSTLVLDYNPNIYNGTAYIHTPEIQPLDIDCSIFYDCANFKNNLTWEEQSPQNILNLNNTAYYLAQLEQYDCAIGILEEIIKVKPNRTVAYLNLGDAYWNKGEKEKAKEAYRQYILLLKKDGKQNKIPSTVKEKLGNDTVNTILDSTSLTGIKPQIDSSKPEVVEGKLLDCYYTNLNGDKIKKAYKGQSVFMVIHSVNMIGKTLNIDISDEDIIYEFNGKEIENQTIENFPIVADKMTLKLKALRKANE